MEEEIKATGAPKESEMEKECREIRALIDENAKMLAVAGLTLTPLVENKERVL